jgi:hypothetical protein
MAAAPACWTFCASRAVLTRHLLIQPGRIPEPASEKIGIATSSLATDFSWLESGVDFVTETELFAASHDHAQAQKARAGQRC